MRQALGMIETKGLVALFEATDAAVKAANVTFTGWVTVGAGLVTTFVEGDVAAERLVVEEGARVSGRVDAGAGEAHAHATSRPAAGVGAPVTAASSPRPNVS